MTFVRDTTPELKNIIEAVTPDFSTDGAWELILIDELIYNCCDKSESQIVCDMAEFLSGKYCKRKNRNYFDTQCLTAKEKSLLLSWNVTPKITLKDNKAVAEYCIYSPVDGFVKVQREIVFKPELELSEYTNIEYSHCGGRLVF